MLYHHKNSVDMIYTQSYWLNGQSCIFPVQQAMYVSQSTVQQPFYPITVQQSIQEVKHNMLANIDILQEKSMSKDGSDFKKVSLSFQQEELKSCESKLIQKRPKKERARYSIYSGLETSRPIELVISIGMNQEKQELEDSKLTSIQRGMLDSSRCSKKNEQLDQLLSTFTTINSQDNPLDLQQKYSNFLNLMKESRLNLVPKQVSDQIQIKNLNLTVKSQQLLDKYNFSAIRQIHRQQDPPKVREKKANSSYVKNSKFHNLNKLFMYNILNMFRQEALDNLNVPAIIAQEQIKLVINLKTSSRKQQPEQQRVIFDYFSHAHYKVLFLSITNENIKKIRKNPSELFLHKLCFDIDLSEEISEIQQNYINIIKLFNFNEHLLNDNQTDTKENVRIKYTLKAIAGIKKLIQGFPIGRF